MVFRIKNWLQWSALLTGVCLIGVQIWNYDNGERRLRHLSTGAQRHVLKSEGTTATSGHAYTIAKLRSAPMKQMQFQQPSPLSQRQKHDHGIKTWPTGEFWNRPHCRNWGAMTTIFPPTNAVTQFANLKSWCLVVAGDFKGPEVYNISHSTGTVVFLSRERQEELEPYFEFVKKTPWNHFARKNIAYLYAIANGAQFIWDFDDDNSLFPNETLARYTTATTRKSSPSSSFGDAKTQVLLVDVQNTTKCGVFNPSSFFRSSEEGIWPRGYPLDKINAPECELQSQYCSSKVSSDRIGIYQSLANKDPDVDAVYRLTRRLPVTFTGAIEDQPVLVPPNTMSPMNAQASLFSHIGLWSMFLPTTVHGRVSDIWRSYIAQTLAPKCGMLVSFVSPHVVQDRNAHTYLADMEAERHLYERSGSLVNYLLNEWEYNNSEAVLEGAWERLYIDLYERGIVEWEDVRLAQMWAAALNSVGYQFPSYTPSLNPTATADSVAREVQSTGQCREWTDRASLAQSEKILKIKTGRACEYNNVVLVGQFNFNTPARRIKHWVQRWREIFQHVEVRGPFDERTMATLRRYGIRAFTAEADSGWYSPMKNLADSLRLHAKDPSKCGVMIAHDDLLLNMTYLNQQGFPSDDTILVQYPADRISKPYVTFYPNETMQVLSNANLTSAREYNVTFDDWPWWNRVVPRVTQAVAGASGREVYSNADGGMDFFSRGQSDFLYIPTSLAEQFASHAEWMVDNEIMLELALPTVVARLQRVSSVVVKESRLCTEWDYDLRDNVSKWVRKCYEKASFGSYHPLKLSSLGTDKWDTFFDRIVLGRVDAL